MAEASAKTPLLFASSSAKSKIKAAPLPSSPLVASVNTSIVEPVERSTVTVVTTSAASIPDVTVAAAARPAATATPQDVVDILANLESQIESLRDALGPNVTKVNRQPRKKR